MKPTSNNDDRSPEISANPGYAAWQLARAFATSEEHPDPATRVRAVEKAENWIKVLSGMFSGALRVGSRTPVAKMPTWVTLQVVQGGFVTGDLLAGGELQPHEEALLKRLGFASSNTPRALLNSYYLSDAGIAELQQMLTTGRYHINVPEEGALLVVVWLLAHRQGKAALDLLDAIGPFLDRLRFYPLPAPRPLDGSSSVYLQTVAETIRNLNALMVPKRILAQQEAILVWGPLRDRAVALFLETLEGPVPMPAVGPDGKPVRGETGQARIDGGWPCQNYPEGWQNRARAWLQDYLRLRQESPHCGKAQRIGETLPLLCGFLQKCCEAPQRLTGRDVGRIRSMLAHLVARRGVPGSEQCRDFRRAQAELINRPTNIELANVVIGRLAELPQEEGLEGQEALDMALAPLWDVEAGQAARVASRSLISSLESKVQRSLTAPVEVLVARKVIPSGETLARVMPQITGQVAAAGLPDTELRRLYGAIYRAFRRRRSLLLLNLQHQVRLAELPWIQGIEAQRQNEAGMQEVARQVLKEVVTLAATAFPHQILPNKLLQEIRSLAESARLDMPLVDEVAADIFMGAFSAKYLQAAQVAGRLLAGSLYERYYGIAYVRVLEIDDLERSRYGNTLISPAFFQLCSDLAGPGQSGSRVAYNGTIIEQEQILTTHNLAVLFTNLGLLKTLQSRGMELAQACFQWVCRRLQQPAPHRKARLHAVKNAAYAWRQMIFFLTLESLPLESLMWEPAMTEGQGDKPGDTEEVNRAFLAWATDYLAQQRPEFQARFQPALAGLERAMQGMSTETSEVASRSDRVKRFLGWTSGTHWLLTPRE